MRRVSRQKGEGKLVGLGIVLLLAFVAWQVYLGATMNYVGIRDLHRRFWSKTSRTAASR